MQLNFSITVTDALTITVLDFMPSFLYCPPTGLLSALCLSCPITYLACIVKTTKTEDAGKISATSKGWAPVKPPTSFTHLHLQMPAKCRIIGPACTHLSTRIP